MSHAIVDESLLFDHQVTINRNESCERYATNRTFHEIKKIRIKETEKKSKKKYQIIKLTKQKNRNS